MINDTRRTRFFLGYHSPVGFISRFDRVYDPEEGWYAFLLGGGPGCGKSSLLKEVGQSLTQKGVNTEYIHCASDPDSLDGVVFPDLKACVLDATAPHVLHPKYPGVGETLVNLGDHWDTAALQKNADEIRKLTKGCATLHSRAGHFLTAAGSMENNTYRYALDSTDTAKIARFATRLVRREIGSVQEDSGHESIRLLSAVTPHGIIFFEETVEKLCPQVFIIEDEYGAASRILLAHLRTQIMAAGYDIITSYCCMAPQDKVEHLLVPALGLAFVTSSQWHRAKLEPYRRIHIQRFTDMTALRQHKQRISFNRRAVRELTAEASHLMLEAKLMHDDLEEYYIAAMNFDAVDERAAHIIDRLSELI